MAVLVRTCCCGCDLRTGIMLIGIIGLLAAGFRVYSGIRTAKVISDYDLKDRLERLDEEEKLPVARTYWKDVINLSYASLAFNVLVLLSNISLLASYGMRNRFLALPYIIVHIVVLAYSLGVTIFFLTIWNGFSVFNAAAIIVVLLYVYFILVVYSYHEALREDPSGTTAGFPGPVPMVQVASGVVGGPPPYAQFP